MRVLTIDLSLTATGVVTPDGASSIVQWAKAPKAAKGGRTAEQERLLLLARLDAARSWAVSVITKWRPDVIAMEGYSYGSKDGHAFDRAEVRGQIRLAAADHGVPFVEIAPGTIKMFATGNGTAGKPDVIANAIRRLGYERADENECDALWMWHLTHQYLGTGESTVVLPKNHTRALEGKIHDIDWQGLAKVSGVDQ